MAMKRSELVTYLDAYLEVASFEGIDRSMNSLVVGPLDREVHTVAFAVDACQAVFEGAIEAGADLLVVHHGLFWGQPLAVCGPHYTRLKTLIEGNLDVYAAHLHLTPTARWVTTLPLQESWGCRTSKALQSTRAGCWASRVRWPMVGVQSGYQPGWDSRTP